MNLLTYVNLWTLTSKKLNRDIFTHKLNFALKLLITFPLVGTSLYTFIPLKLILYKFDQYTNFLYAQVFNFLREYLLVINFS